MPAYTSFQLPKANLRKLRNMTANIYAQRAEKCRVASQQYGYGSRIGFQRSRPKYPTYYNEMRGVVVCPSGKRRYAYIRFYGPPEEKTPVWVWCSCEDFGYRLEWVLSKIGSSSLSPGYEDRGPEIIDEPPTVRNKQKKPGLCKHLLEISPLALAQTKDYAKEQGAKRGYEASAQQNMRTGAVEHLGPYDQILTFE